MRKNTPLLDRLLKNKNFNDYSDLIIKFKNNKSKKGEKATVDSDDMKIINELE